MKCRICANAGPHALYEASEMMYGTRERFPYFQCIGCRCLQIVDVPADLGRYYGAAYYSFSGARAGGMKSRLIGLRDRHAALKRGGLWGALLCKVFPTGTFRFLEPLRTVIGTGTRVLDVGCGGGALLRQLKSAGLAHVAGVDAFIETDVTEDGRRLVLKGTLDDVDGVFDLVMFHHSLEHMPDQSAVMRRAFDLIAPGGHCLVRIPLASSEAWEKYGTRWVQLDAPRHLYLHSEESMERLATQAGFECREVRYDSTAFQFWGSEQYAMDIPLRSDRSWAVNPGKSPFTAADITRYEAQAARLNEARRGDQAAFYLRKPGP